jgi:squalene-hopene/tetraprenyl-beta-curcumene cyclase
MSYIHAQVDKNDPRVKAVMEWLRSNYSIAENPGMGQQGYYYYLHLMAKALKAAGVERFKLSSGQEIDWRKEVAGRLIELQKPDGSWVNPETRWWESDPVLVTSYALMTLELIDSGSKN